MPLQTWQACAAVTTPDIANLPEKTRLTKNLSEILVQYYECNTSFNL